MKRVYHHYEKWEETHAGLWVRLCGEERTEAIRKALDFMLDTAQFKAAMLRVIVEWPISCEVNFTSSGTNRQAWLGHAATCIAVGSPEETTRAAWWKVPEELRNAADEAAAEVILIWEHQYQEALNAKSKNRDRRFDRSTTADFVDV